MKKYISGNIINFLEMLMCLFSLFPFVTPIQMGTDTQPYALLFATLYLLITNKSFSKTEISFFILAIISTIVLAFSAISSESLFTMFRSYYNYVCIAILPIGIETMLERHSSVFERVAKFSIIIWLIIGLIQLLLNRYFCSAIVSNFRTSPTRGVCSLASEPSFYGYMCFFFIIISTFFKSRRKLYIGISVFQLIFLAQSTVSLIYLMVFLLIYLIVNALKNRDIKSIFIIIVAGVTLIFVIKFVLHFLGGTRIGLFVYNFVYNRDAVLGDESVEQRLNSITVSLNSFVSGFGIPHGFATYITSSKRIMSGYGAFLHEMGFIGLIYIVYWYKLIAIGVDVSYAISLSIIMFSAIQIGNPIFAILIGIAIYRYKKRNASKSHAVCIV